MDTLPYPEVDGAFPLPSEPALGPEEVMLTQSFVLHPLHPPSGNRTRIPLLG